MKKHFNHYYLPTESEFRTLWSECIFVLDANIILNFYRYSLKTTDELFAILENEKIKNRLWIPNQAGEEFHRNRLGVIYRQKSLYEIVSKNLDSVLESLVGMLSADCPKHPYIDRKKISRQIEKTFNRIKKDLKESERKHPDYSDRNKDQILNRITNLFENKVGDPYTDERIKEIIREGAIRFDQQIPPGYADLKDKKDDKTGKRIYGDLILWNQIIDKAKDEQKPIILLIDDVKEDWWRELHGKKIGPREELIKEIKDKTNVDFYMYQTDQFISYAKEYLDITVGTDVLNEIKSVKDSDSENTQKITNNAQSVGISISSMIENIRNNLFEDNLASAVSSNILDLDNLKSSLTGPDTNLGTISSSHVGQPTEIIRGLKQKK